MLYHNEPIITPDTYRDHLGDLTSRLCGTKPRVRPPGTLTFAAQLNMPLIPRSAWPAMIAAKEKAGGRLSDLLAYYNVPCLNQEQTNYCHANSPALAIMALRAAMGLPFVLLSPASIGGPITGYTNQGACIEDDLQRIVNFGCASQEFVPANQIGLSGFKPGWEANALEHRVLEWWDMGYRTDGLMFDRVATLLLAGFPVCVAYNWWGHAVTAIDLVMLSNGRFGVRIRNSWGSTYGANGYAVIEEGQGTPDAAYSPRVVSQGKVLERLSQLAV